MKRAYIPLYLGLGLLLCSATPSLSAATEAQKEAIKKLPHDLSHLLESTFYCRGVAGDKPYTDARALTLNVLSTLTDAAAAERFVAGRERAFEAGCPQAERATCWADYFDMSGDDRDAGKDECDFEQALASAEVVLTLRTIRGTPAS